MDNKIAYTFKAKEDLREIYEYISKVLHNEDAAKNLRDKIIDKISDLKKHPFVGIDLYLMDIKTEYKYLIVDNYNVFYKIRSNIEIERIIYGGRDYLKVLFK